MVKFLRRTWSRYSKLGKGRKKKQVWRRPTGRDNKMRERRKGYPAVVSIGYKTNKQEHKEIFKINTLNDFQKIPKETIVIFAKIGEKKKIEFAKLAKEKKITISNLNVEKFLKNVKEKNDKKIAAKKKTEEKGKKKNAKSQSDLVDKKQLTGEETDKQSPKSEELANKKISEPLGEANKEDKK